jgi:serine phosphatase RsbU (regulator of sigma subunit)
MSSSNAAALPVANRFLLASRRTRCRLHLASAQVPAAGLSGDSVAWFDHADGHFTAVLADVSGNGLGVAGRADRLQALVGELVQQRLSPGATLTALNHRLEREAACGEFVTALVAHLDTRRLTIRVASAGHLGPFVRRSSGPSARAGWPTGPALGIFAAQAYDDAVLKLRIGDTVVFATDGVTDGFRTDADFLGESDVMAHLAGSEGEPTAICRRLVERRASPGQVDASVLAVQLTLAGRAEGRERVQEALAGGSSRRRFGISNGIDSNFLHAP